MRKIGFIGAGNMGMAIARGMVSASLSLPESIVVYDVFEDKQSEAKKFGFQLAESAAALCAECDLIVFAVKPQTLESVLQSIAGYVKQLETKLFITIAAGISISFIQSYLGNECKVVRVMPNTPLMIGKGARVRV